MGIVESKTLLRDKDLKATEPRIRILDLLLSESSAVSYSTIQKTLQPIDRVTLYRTIDTFIQKGLIHKAFQDNSDVFYALCGSSCSEQDHVHDHVHFRCERCEEVTCLEPENSVLIKLPNHQISITSIQVQGICENCN